MGVSLCVLAACATPGINYTAKIAPGNPAAATYRTVAVDQFIGPLGSWYAGEFEAMLASALYEGQPWFTVGLFARQSNVEGVYDGSLDVGYPHVSEHYFTTTDCVEKKEIDGETKCVKKIDVEHVCLTYSVDVSVRPRLIDQNTGEIIHQTSYTGRDSEEECFETGHVEYRVRRGPDDPGRGKFRFAYEDYQNSGYQLGGDYIIDRITESALRQTLWQARRDIAPYNQDVRATIVTKAQNLEVGADPRFAQAVAAIREQDPGTACALFTDLAAAYEAAPAVLHNLGACAEALGHQERAQALYGEATAGARKLGTEPNERMLEALNRISNQRSDAIILNELIPDVPEHPDS